MRLSSIAAGILILALAGDPAASAIASRAASRAPRTGAPQGPMSPGSSDPGGQSGPGGPGAPAQNTPQQPPQPLQVRTTIVNVFATVRDKRNAILSDLTKDDFKIYEDGVEQKVAYFSKEVELPITLGVLIDTSGSMRNILGAEQDAASRFVKEVMRKKDEAMVISFDLDVNLLADFTQDTSVLERAIHRAQINAAGPVVTPGTVPQRGGGTNLYDAVYLACHDQLATEAGRKAMILLTDAEDTGSQMSEQDAIQAAQRADAVIHVLLITDYSAASGSGGGVASKMAGDTGGRVIDVHNQKTLEKAFDQISEELRSQYVLSYYPTNAKRDGAFRKIKVEASRRDAKILARKGYYAPVR
jgi:VWFA-related protein